MTEDDDRENIQIYYFSATAHDKQYDYVAEETEERKKKLKITLKPLNVVGAEGLLIIKR